MRRLAALALVVLAACGSERDPSATPAAPDAGMPPLLVASSERILRYQEGRATTVAEVGAMLAVDDPRGGVLYQTAEDEHGIRRRDAARTTDVVQPVSFLHDVASIDGEPSLVFATFDHSPGAENRGSVEVMALASGRRRVVAPAFGPEYGVGRVSFGGGILAVTATVDLGEVVRFYAPDGSEVKREGPASPYARPPLLAEAVLSPDASALAYLEGPDVDAGGDGETKVGEWELVVRDLETGDEAVRVRIAGRDVEVVRLDFDGRWAVVSSTHAVDGRPLPVLAVDTSAREPAPETIPDVLGVASIAG